MKIVKALKEKLCESLRSLFQHGKEETEGRCGAQLCHKGMRKDR